MELERTGNPLSFNGIELNRNWVYPEVPCKTPMLLPGAGERTIDQWRHKA
jgi:hypothetical protein